MHRRDPALAGALLACAGLAWGSPQGATAVARIDLDEPDCAPDRVCAKAEFFKSLFRRGLPPTTRVLRPSAFQGREAMSQTDLLHSSLEIEAFPATQNISGTSTLTLQSKVDGLAEFTFQLADALTIGTILVNSNAVPPPIPVGAYSKRIVLDRSYGSGEIFTVVIPYSGPALANASSILWSNQDGQPIVSSFSEPYDAGSWWACKDGDFGLPGDNSDKATFDIAIIHDQATTAISNGTLQGVEDLGNGKYRTRWSTGYPLATYLACFSTAKYNSWFPTYTGSALDGPGTIEIPLRFYIWSGNDSPARRAAWEKVIPALDVYRPIFGEYPFAAEGYGIYQFPFSGGMEHQTMSGQGNFAESVTVHELAHQWWGDNVTCKTWNDIWLNEGFATYSEALWSERKPGSPGAIDLQNYMTASKPLESKVGGTVYCDDTSSIARIFDRDLTYRKGAWVLHMLRGIVGDQTFFNIVAAWRAAYQGSAATTDDFKDVAEHVSGQDLTWFFDQWVFGVGAPTYAKGLQSFVLNGKNWTRFHVRQIQNPAWPTFTNPLDVRFSTAAGYVETRVRPIARTSYFVRSTGEATAADVFFDWNNWVLHYGIGGEAPLPGPPVILESSPAAGDQSVFSHAPDRVQFTFSEPVQVFASNFLVIRAADAGGVPFSFSYDSPTQIATLAFNTRLSPGTYTIAVVSDPISALTGQSLDGDVFAPSSPTSFPTGDGVAGTTLAGSTILQLTVVPGSCPCDLNLDTMVDDSDFVIFAAAYNELLTMAADFNGDGLTDDSDFVIFATAYDQLACP